MKYVYQERADLFWVHAGQAWEIYPQHDWRSYGPVDKTSFVEFLVIDPYVEVFHELSVEKCGNLRNTRSHQLLYGVYKKRGITKRKSSGSRVKNCCCLHHWKPTWIGMSTVRTIFKKHSIIHIKTSVRGVEVLPHKFLSVRLCIILFVIHVGYTFPCYEI